MIWWVPATSKPDHALAISSIIRVTIAQYGHPDNFGPIQVDMVYNLMDRKGHCFPKLIVSLVCRWIVF